MSAFPYELQFGYCCNEKIAFATFAEALAAYRGYLARAKNSRREGSSRENCFSDDGPRLVNIDNIDGAEDSSAASQHGLTAEEYEQVQEVG